MDNIRPQQPIHALPNTRPAGGAPTIGNAAARQEPSDVVALGRLGNLPYSPEDLTPDGKLRVIIQADNPAALERLKNEDIFKSPNATLTSNLPIINAVAAEVEPTKLGPIFQDDALQGLHVFVDGRVRVPEPIDEWKDGQIGIKLDVATKTLGMDKVWAEGYTGKGINIAIVDTGIDPHPDIKDRILAFHDVTKNQDSAPYDDEGHGTHVSGDAAGSGKMSGGKYKGPAPDAGLVGVKVLDANGSGTFSDVIKGMQWVVDNAEKYNIRVMNMSLGARESSSYKDDPVAMAVEKVYEKGIVPVIAAGNSGPLGKTIGTPANAPDAVTVGALDDKGTVDRSDDGIPYWSSRGPTKFDGLAKPDVITPGANITSLKPGGGYTSMSGTSMATPITAGVVATILQANPKLTPAQLKEILMDTADKLKGPDANAQGSGVIDPYAAIEKAKALAQTPAS